MDDVRIVDTTSLKTVTGEDGIDQSRPASLEDAIAIIPD
jgi:hypothetical protein